ncbi:MAG: hypothetical protein WCY43_00370 [Patescibacteria group bacterium]|nr:hypothetical protein [Patescibacteria group bacterium]
MFENFFNKKKEKPFLSVADYNVFLNEKKVEQSNDEIKSLLEKIINSPEVYIENLKGQKLIGNDFDTAREIIWRNLNSDNNEMKKIEEALNQNKLSYNRVSQLLLILDLAKDKLIKVDDLKKKLSSLIAKVDNKKYSNMALDEKEFFMNKVDEIATHLYDRL